MSKKVVIVEDNALILRLFTDLLNAHHFIVEGVRDGRAALEEARKFAPDLLTTMQKDASLTAVPVLAVTAYAGKGDEERIMATGAKGYLPKPAPVMELLEAVQGIIGLQRRSRHNRREQKHRENEQMHGALQHGGFARAQC